MAADRSVEVVTETWRIIEETLEEAGVTGPSRGAFPARSRADEVSKVIVARLARRGIIPAFADEVRPRDA